jgi:hypothetical protein
MRALLLSLGPSCLLLLLYGLSVQLSRLLLLLVARVVYIGVFPCISSADEEPYGFTGGRGVWD